MSDSTVYTRHEAAFASWAIAQGWKVTKRGWPDFICRRDDELMAVEVKGGNDGLSHEQHATIADLRAIGLPTYVWTPEYGLSEIDLPMAESVQSLRAENARLRSFIEGRVLAQLAGWCKGHHSKHTEMYGDGMPLCPWVLYLSARYPIAEIGTMVSLDLEAVTKLLNRVMLERDDWLHRERHHVWMRSEKCEQCRAA